MAEDSLPEEWRLVEDWPDYEVSSLGRVRKAKDSRPNGLGIVMYPKGHVLVRSRHKGHWWVGLTKDRKSKTVGVAVLVCAAWHGPKPSWRHEVLHGNGDGFDDRPSNLRWGTRLENAEDKIRHGKMPMGESHWRTVLTEAQVREIKRLLAESDLRAAEIAARYGVSPQTISNIKNGLCWRWVC